MELLIKVVGPDNIMFASEMLGGVNTTDPLTGRSFDDNKPCVDAIAWLTAEDRKKIFEDNARKAYPRVAPMLQIFVAIDNLVKGAAGQAIQNANLLCDFDETAGLPH